MGGILTQGALEVLYEMDMLLREITGMAGFTMQPMAGAHGELTGIMMMAAYHRHIQPGLIAQGLLQILSATVPQRIWRSFGSWIRTVRPGLAPPNRSPPLPFEIHFPIFSQIPI